MTEHLQIQIIKKAYQGGYAHAENILHRLRELEAMHPVEKAIEILHQEVITEGEELA